MLIIDVYKRQAYFDAKAIERRLRTGIPVDDATDWPVNESYVNQVTTMVDEVIIASHWLNAVAVEVSDAQLTACLLYTSRCV